MGIRDLLSRLKDRPRVKSKGRKRKPDDTGSDIDGEGADPSGSLSRPVSYVVTGVHDGGGGGSDADGRWVSSRDLLPQLGKPESAPNNREGGEADAGGGGIGQKDSHLGPDIKVVVGSGPTGEGDDADREKVESVHPSLSNPLISQSGKLDGAWIQSF